MFLVSLMDDLRSCIEKSTQKNNGIDLGPWIDLGPAKDPPRLKLVSTYLRLAILVFVFQSCPFTCLSWLYIALN